MPYNSTQYLKVGILQAIFDMCEYMVFRLLYFEFLCIRKLSILAVCDMLFCNKIVPLQKIYEKEFGRSEYLMEKAVLIGIITPQQPETKAKEYIEELAFLSETAGAVPVKRFFQNLPYPNPRTFVGEGKLAEIREYIADNEEITLVIFDDELSPV